MAIAAAFNSAHDAEVLNEPKSKSSQNNYVPSNKNSNHSPMRASGSSNNNSKKKDIDKHNTGKKKIFFIVIESFHE